MVSPKPRIQLIFDWDGTMTTEDTTAVIGSRCIDKAQEIAPAHLCSEKQPSSMEYYTNKYFHEYREWKYSHTSSLIERKTVEDEVSFLSQSKHVEQDSFLRVRRALFNVPSMGELEHDELTRNKFMVDAGRAAVRNGEVQIREAEALTQLIAAANKDGNTWGIVSVSWSRRFILGALLETGLVEEDRVEDVAKRIQCNELLAPIQYDHENNPITICSPSDKRSALDRFLAEWESRSASRDHNGTIVVYVGDSTTDIGCLCGANIGMYLHGHREDDPVIETLDRLQVDRLPINQLPYDNVPSRLAEMSSKLKHERKPADIVCHIRNLQELSDWLLRLK